MPNETTDLLLFPSTRIHPDTVSSEEFLRWAKSDLKGGGRRECGNALGNIKKAIHAKIDDLVFKTHARFGNNWNPLCGTETKLKILKMIGIEHGAVINLVTDRRNNYEHKYRVPKKTEVEAFLAIAELWLKNVRDAHSFQPVGIVGMKVTQLKVVTGGVCTVDFLRPALFRYFWDPKKILVTIESNGKKSIVPYSDFKWEELVKLEGRCIKKSFNHFTSVPRSQLTRVYKLYERWVAQRVGT